MSYLFLGPCLSVQAILNISDDTILSGIYLASNKIILTDRVPSGNQVIFSAPNGVEAMPQFQADLGIEVDMEIGGCGN